jgi:MYXO-CTERM domain-containing protein
MNKTTAFFARTALAAALTAGAMSSAFAGIYSTLVGGAIPDNNPTGISTSITVADSGTISSFDFVTITGLQHTWIGDLVITLSHDGTTVDIIDRVARITNTGAGDNSNLLGDYTFQIAGASFSAAATAAANNDILSPAIVYTTFPNATNGNSGANNTLNNFLGQTVSGVWTLTIADRESLDFGSFTGFSFGTHNSTSEVPLPGSVALLGLGLLGFAARRRKA